MKVVVVGAGKIGTTIIESLVRESNDVLCIDSSLEVVERLANTYDVMTLCGNGSSYDTLKEAGMENTELFIAVTGSDEFNMLSCFVARKMGAKQTVARIRDLEYNTESLGFLKDSLQLSMAINPEKLTAEALFNLLKLPTALKVETFTSRKFQIVELLVKKDSYLDGISLIDLRKKHSEKFLVCVLHREEEVYIPSGNTKLLAGDKICIIATSEETHKLLKSLGILQKESRDIIILGGSKTAQYLTQLLLKDRSSVRIIERDKERCEELCEHLPNGVDVVCGDGTSQDILAEEGIDSTDALVALTGSDEENILISFYAMSKKVPKVISKVNRNELSSLAEKLGLDCIVSPKQIIADILVRYARALKETIGSKVESLYSLMNGNAEALEFVVTQNTDFTETPLKNLNLKSNVLIAGIIRGVTPFIPGGDDMIKVGDKVIVVAKGRSLSSLSEIVEGN